MKERDYVTIMLEKLIACETGSLVQEKNELKKLPEGTLVARKRKNGKWFYASRIKDKEIGISKDETTVFALARKQNLLSSIPYHIANISLLKETCNNLTINKVRYSYNKKSPAHLQGVYSQKQLLWMSSNQSQNPYSPEHLIYKCSNDIMVRSKSERIIANKLLEYGIIFKYESPLEIEGITYYPDFTILRQDGIIVLWEHNGLMSNEDYFFKSVQKTRKYKKKGLVPHRNLICTEEEDIRDESILDEIIFKFLLF